MFSAHLLFNKCTTLLLLVFSFTGVAAQKATIKGLVVDEKGDPVQFAAVNLTGAKVGTSTNDAGRFVINTAKMPVTLIISAVGYVTTEKKLTEKDFIDSVCNVKLVISESSSVLSDVVITGYGSSGVYGELLETTSAAPATTAPGIKRTPRAAKKTVTKTTFSEYESTRTLTGTMDKKDGKQNLLTAGEVNDFKKWNMWEDYNQTDFKTYSANWGLNATQRYSVQLLNDDFRAITGQRIYLIDQSTGDTVWTAVSDNTGKAELWKNFSLSLNSNELFIGLENEPAKYPAIPFNQGINRIKINRTCAVSNKVEIAFVVDATGSMKDEIDYLKEELEDILTKISVKDPSIDLHTGAVFYRDKGDDYVTRTQPFSAGIANTIGFIKNQTAGGGGDYPEAVNDAMQDAIGKLEWSTSARTKIIFLLMDAPPHDYAKKEMAALIENAAAKSIRIVPVACSGTDKLTEFIMRSMALATNGTYLFLTDDSGIGNGHIKPTTDEIKVELLNDLLQRTIEQMCFVNDCNAKATITAPLSHYNNPENIRVYPNPTTGPVTLETSKDLKEILVADFTGKILMRADTKGKKGKYPINLSAFPSATYFIRYVTTNNTIGAEKIVLAR